MNILEVIYTDTPWKKTGLDWDQLPAELVRINPTNQVSKKDNTVDTVKAELEAWRKTNPRSTPEQAWTALGGKGPAPRPEKTMPGRDLRVEPPDDTGNWIDMGDAWQSKSLPIEYAIKPNPKKPNTWGKNWKPADQVIDDIRDDAKKNKKKVSDAEIDKQLRAMEKKNGDRMYSDKEIADAWKNVKHKDVFTGLENPPDPEEQKKDDTNDKGPPKPVKGSDGNFTCEAPWVYDEKTKSCVKKVEAPVVVTPTPPINTEAPPKPVKGKDGKLTCEAPWVYDETTKSCVKKGETPPPVAPPGDVSIQMPMGTKNDINTSNPYNSKTHKGIDIKGGPGLKVVAPENGSVTAMNKLDKNGKPIFGDAGLFLNFTSTDGKRVHKFFHLSVLTEFGGADKLQLPFSFNKGQTLALSGGEKGAYGAGNSSGPHLHWEVWVDGSPVDPMTLVK